MSTLILRDLDPAIEQRLRIRAAQHGHSVEAEVASILRTTLRQPEPPRPLHLYERIRARFEPLGGAEDLELLPRLLDRDPPQFD